MAKMIKLEDETVVYESSLIAKVASFLYCETATKTDYNNWIIYFSDIEDAFQLKKGYITLSIAKKIKKVLLQDFETQVAFCDIDKIMDNDYCFDVTLWNDYIPGWTQEDPAFATEE